MKNRIFSTGFCWLWVALLVFTFDQATKFLALTYLVEYIPFTITQFFNLTLAYNKGAAFSFLDQADGWQTWFFGCLAIVISMGLLVWLRRISCKQRWLGIALCLIMGGALGNVFDRIFYGHVIDFIQLHTTHLYWPVFNIADSAICVGAFMLFFDAVFFKKK